MNKKEKWTSMKRIAQKKRVAVKKKADTVKKKADADAATDVVCHVVNKLFGKARHHAIASIADDTLLLLNKFGKLFQMQLSEEFQVFSKDAHVPVLPDNIKYYTKIGNMKIAVLEYKPQVRTLQVAKILTYCLDKRSASSLKTHESRTVPVSVALPYVILTFVFYNDRYEKLYAHYRNSPLTNLDDVLLYSNLPNINNSKVCTGQIFDENYIEAMSKLPFGVQIERAASVFWQSVFNIDYTEQFRDIAAKNPCLENMQCWHDATIADPLFILKIDWKIDRRLSKLIEDIACGNLFLSGKNLQKEINDTVNAMKCDLDKAITARIGDLKVTDSEVIKAVNDSIDHRAIILAANERMKIFELEIELHNVKEMLKKTEKFGSQFNW